MSDTSIRILLVGDMEGDARLVEELLHEDEGHEAAVVQCHSMDEAIARCARESFDVVLVDARLSDGRGQESLEPLRQAVGAAPILAMARQEDDHLAREALRRGADDFFIKDHMENGVLARAIRFSLERQSLERALHSARAALEEKARKTQGRNTRLLRNIRIQAENYDTPEESRIPRRALDALSTQIGVLDEDGRLIHVNMAWLDFENSSHAGGAWRRSGAGDDFLKTCEDGAGLEGRLGPGVARAIRRLLAREQDIYTIEFSCYCSGNKHWFSERLARFEDRDGQTRVIIARENISALKKLESQVSSSSLHDKVTGLYNRLGFLMMAEHETLLAERRGVCLQIVTVGVDNLIAINAAHGRAVGDRVLELAARAVRARVRKSDIVARVGGGTFAAMAREATMRDESMLFRRLSDALPGLRLPEYPDIALATSVGYARWDPHSPVEIEELLIQSSPTMRELDDSLV